MSTAWIARALVVVGLPLVAAACVYPFDPQDGRVLVQVSTEAGQAVAGVQATLIGGEGQIMNGLEGRTDAQGEIHWEGAPVGDWSVRLQLPTGYSLAPGQGNPVPVTVRDDREARVQVTLSGPT